jgi:hypothetical protein
MSLHDDIQSHINELQELLKETNEDTLLDKAREQWGEDDSRYEVLEQFVESPSSSRFSKQAKPPLDRFDKPAAPPAPESGSQDGGSVQNKPVK